MPLSINSSASFLRLERNIWISILRCAVCSFRVHTVLGVVIKGNVSLSTALRWVGAASRGNRMLGFNDRCITARNKDVTLYKGIQLDITPTV